jgi:acyl-coenzyme A thioesterase PaaI-like protein
MSLSSTPGVLQMVLLKSEQALEVNGCIVFGPRSLGPPLHVHGGCQAAVLDEMMGSTGWHFGHAVVAAKIEVSFFEMVPIGVQLELKGKIISQEERKIVIQASLLQQGKLLAQSSGLFIVLKEEDQKKLGVML